MGGIVYVDDKPVKELDNFYICSFWCDGKEYCSSEHYFQEQKSDDESYRNALRLIAHDSKKVYKMGHECKLRNDWDDIRVGVMYIANLLKISQNTDIANHFMGCENVYSIKSTGSTDFWNRHNSLILRRVITALFELRG